MVHRLHAKFTRRYWFPDFNKHTNESTKYTKCWDPVSFALYHKCVQKIPSTE